MFTEEHEQVADFGAGEGVFALSLSSEVHRALRVEADSVFRSLLMGRGLETISQLESTPNTSVGCLYSFNVSEHIADDGATLQLWYSKLCDRGRLLLYVPALPVLYTSLDRPSAQYRRYRLRSTRARLLAAGLRADSAEYVDSLGFVAAMAHKLIDDGSGTINQRAVRVYDRYVFRISRTLNHLLHSWLGKNLLVAAHKPYDPQLAGYFCP